MSDSQANYRSLIQISIITIVSGIILYIVIKKLMNYVNSENEGGVDNVKKRLFYYFTSEPTYDSLEKNNKPVNNVKLILSRINLKTIIQNLKTILKTVIFN